MEDLKKIFVVMDPTVREQHALNSAADIAQRRKSEIHAYLCIHSDLETSDIEELKATELERYEPWLEKYIKPVRKQGIKVQSELDWDEDWMNKLGKAVKKVKPDLIVKATRRNPSSRKLQMLSSDWALFESAVCPVMLVNPDTKPTGKILCAIDINRKDKRYKEIMKLVINHAQSVAESRKARLHVVNAYIDQDDYVHVTDVAKLVGIPNRNVHVVGAQPEQAIYQVATEIDAEMVIMGLSTKSKLANRLFGYTSEWLLNSLTQDVYVIIPKKK
jgi:nucleotide-binding universal stress UspA family protein